LVAAGATASSDNEIELNSLLGTKEERQKAAEISAGLSYTADADVQLDTATSVWANDLKQSYIDEVQTTYSADSYPMPPDFHPIDDWVENKTEGMVPGLMGDEPMDPNTVALLVNAVYFKGAWTNPFDPDKTRSGEFTLADGSKTVVEFMSAARMMNVTSSSSLGGASVVLLEYGDATDFSAMFILPESPYDDSLGSVISGLVSTPMSELLDEMYPKSVQLKLPRFNIHFGPEKLKPVLQSMGMNVAFDRGVHGKFDKMSDDTTIWLEDVFHAVSMTVTEEGTEAAAASSAEIRTRTLPKRLVFDRPFVVVVFHKLLEIPLFMGKVMNPS
jgi:serpin B